MFEVAPSENPLSEANQKNSLPNRLFFMLASMKKSCFFTLKLLFFTLELLAGITFFDAGEKAGFRYSAVEGSLINLLRTLYGQGYNYIRTPCKVRLYGTKLALWHKGI
jgi:hypothetical protein